MVVQEVSGKAHKKKQPPNQRQIKSTTCTMQHCLLDQQQSPLEA